MLRILRDALFYNWTPTDNKTGMCELHINMDSEFESLPVWTRHRHSPVSEAHVSPPP